MHEKDDSIMTDLFEGQLMSCVTCLSCGFKSATFDNFMDLSIEIPRKAIKYLGSISLQDCLKTFFSKETMRDCGYKCSKCKKEVSIEKEMSIYRLPRLLTIHLKRFYHSAMRREKISSTVNFPDQGLNMKQFASQSNHSSVNNSSYRLYGISHHSGSLYGGHYISEVCNVNTNKWYNCNDSHVSQISRPDNSSTSAYVLFYVMQ